MKPPRGPRPPIPATDLTLARLRQLIDATTQKSASAKRQMGPPPAELELAYLLVLPSPQEPQPVVTVVRRRKEHAKKPEPWALAQVTAKTIPQYPDVGDREILWALSEATESTASRLIQIEDGPRSRFALSRAACEKILPLLGRSGRLRVRLPGGDLVHSWHEAPWAFRMRVTIAAADPASPDAPPAWEIDGLLHSSIGAVPLTEVDTLLDSGFVFARGRLARLDDGGATSWLGMLRTHRRLRIPQARRATFLEEVFAVPSPPIDLPPGDPLHEIVASPEPRLTVHSEAAASGALFAELSFLYDGIAVASQRAGRTAFDVSRSALVRRDLEVEAKARARVAELGVEPLPKSGAEPPPAGAHLAVPAARLPAIVAALSAEGFLVEAGEGRAYRKAGDFKIKIASGIDWFDVEGEIAWGSLTAPLSAVLDAIRRGQSFVVLDDGTLGLLPEQWLARHSLVLRLGVAHEGRLRFAKSQTSLLIALASAEPQVRVDAPFAAIREALAAGVAIEPADPPPGFVGSLRVYQREGLGWLRAILRSGLGGLLADDMGLGKTVQVLALLAERRGRPSLIVAPRSLIFNWKRESARFTPGLRVLDHTGSDRRPPGDHFRDHDLVITTYGTLRRDATALAAIDFDQVVLDEAQAIKNEASETSRAARLLKASGRLALSGTPVENHLRELWSLVDFLNPGMLGRSSAWKAATDARPSPEALELLRKALAPLLLRRTKAEVAPFLPARMDETLVCELDAPERALYDELRDRFRAELLGHVQTEGLRSAGTRVLEALLRLRQAACHPGLLDPSRKGERSAKLDALLPELVSLRENGQKALVFSQFRTLLDIVRPVIEAEGITCVQLDGRTRDRQSVVAQFQEDPSVGVMLVSLKAGGVGLNLTAAEYVFLLDPWWNPAAEAQAIDRAHRIGQTKAVFAYRLIAKDTVEERIAELQQQKRALSESVIRGDGAALKGLTIEDLELLLS